MKHRVFIISFILIILAFPTTPTVTSQGTDSDGDGISNADETAGTYGYVTDPYNADTDGDGISDSDEVFGNNGWHTDPTNWDTDTDSISDLDEISGTYGYNTNPLRYDSDFDGLSDYEEQVTYGTNPNSYDSDGDQLSDNDEIFGVYAAPTDPWNPDTDGDGQPDGLEALSYNTDPTSSLSYGDMTLYDYDGDGISDYDEFYTYFTSYYENDTDHDYASDYDEIFYLLTGPTTPDWDGDGNPDGLEAYYYGTDPKNGTDYVDMSQLDTDNDHLTDYAEYYYYDTNILNPDTDGDSQPDALEVNSYNTDPLDPNSYADMTQYDYDGDGLTDYDELFVYLTSPFDYDTDHDYSNDYDEIFNLYTDPNNPDSDYDGNPDGLEAYYYNTNPLNGGNWVDMTTSDIDGDGLNDYDEFYVYGTRVNNSDTDHDSFTDYEEAIAGFDPLDSKIVPAWPDPYEPNNDPTQATSFGFGTIDSLSIDVVGGQDWFVFTILTTMEVHLFTSSTQPNADTTMGLYNTSITPGDTYVAYNDDYWNLMSHLNLTLSPGNYYVKIEAFANNRLINNYQLYLVDSTMDSDGDGIPDVYELLDYHTNPNSWDSDGDGLDDNEEINNFGTDPNMFDTDYDGLSDYDEIYVYGTDPLNQDTDGDGLIDGDEISYSYTDPNNWDTDGDGFSDYEEFYSGTDPNDPNSTLSQADAYEYDDDWNSANYIEANSDSPYHSIHTSSDSDWYFFTLDGSAHVTVYTDGDPGGDTLLELNDDTLSQIASDDDSGTGGYSRIEVTLGPGTYYLRVSSFYGDLINNYYVHLTVNYDQTTFSESNNGNDNNSSSAPGLPIPISITPVLISIFGLMMINFRKRK